MEETVKKKRGRKAKAEEGGEAGENNIANLADLAAEYTKNKMPERKLIALRVKLIQLFNSEEITEEEQELMEKILRKERGMGRINSADEYMLNRIEAERLEDICIVKSDDTPVVHHLYKHLECKYFYDGEYNDGKGKKDSVGRFFVYVPRVVPTEHQLSNATVRKENNGHPTDPKEYPAPRTLIHRLGLKQKEFDAWFEADEDHLSKKSEEKLEEYTF